MSSAPLSSGDIAKAVGRDAATVRHILDSRGIQPIGRAGIVRLFDRSVVERVRDELARVKPRRRREAVTN